MTVFANAYMCLGGDERGLLNVTSSEPVVTSDYVICIRGFLAGRNFFYFREFLPCDNYIYIRGDFRKK